MKSRGLASDEQNTLTKIEAVVSGRRIGSIGRCMGNGIEQGKQQQPGEKTADMRLPGHADALCADCDRSDAENDVDAKPDGEKRKHTAIAQYAQQWLRRHPGGGIGITAVKGK